MVFIHIWPIIYPYYASYIHSVNSTITMNIVFSGLLFYYLGNILGSYINPLIIRVIGFKNNLFLAALLNLLLCYLLTLKFSIFFVFFARMI